MKKSNKPTYDGIEFDSNDEIQFYKWLVEAKELGLIHSFEFHPETIGLIEKASYIEEVQLKTKTKKVSRHLMASLDYTPDFILYGAKGIVFNKRFQHEGTVVVDIKPSFDLHKNSTKFSVVQKVILHIKGIYVHKVETAKFFKSNGVPVCMKRKTKSGTFTGKWKNSKTIVDIFFTRKLTQTLHNVVY